MAENTRGGKLENSIRPSARRLCVPPHRHHHPSIRPFHSLPRLFHKSFSDLPPLSLKWEKPEQPSLTPFSLIRRVSFSFTPFSARAHSIVVRLFRSAPGSKTIKERVLRTPRLRRQRRIAARQSQFKFTCEARSPLFVLLLLHSISFSICNKPHDSCKIDCMTTSRVWSCVKWARKRLCFPTIKLRGPRHYSNQLPPLYLYCL